MVPLSTGRAHLKALVGQSIVGIARPSDEGLRPYFSDAIPHKNYLIGKGKLALIKTETGPILGFRPRERGMHLHVAPIEELFNLQFPEFAHEHENLQVGVELGNAPYEVEISRSIIGRTIISIDVFVKFVQCSGNIYREERALRLKLNDYQELIIGFHIGPSDTGYALRFLRTEHIEEHLHHTSKFMDIDEIAAMKIPSNLGITTERYY